MSLKMTLFERFNKDPNRNIESLLDDYYHHSYDYWSQLHDICKLHEDNMVNHKMSIGILITYDQCKNLVRCHVCERIGEFMRNYEPWENEKTFSYVESSDPNNLPCLKSLKQNIKRLYQLKSTMFKSVQI